MAVDNNKKPVAESTGMLPIHVPTNACYFHEKYNSASKLLHPATPSAQDTLCAFLTPLLYSNL